MVTTKRKNDIASIDANISEPINLQTASEIETKRLAQKMGADLLLEAIAEPTLDRYLDGNPKVTFKSDDDWREFVGILQKKRALFITAEQKKKEPKEEGTDE